MSVIGPATTFAIGGDLPVARLGFGAMRLTGQPGNFGPYHDPERGVALLRRAYDLGVRFIDTARSYGPGWNERLIAQAFTPYPDDLVIATKVGVEKPTSDSIYADGRPEAIRRGVAASLRDLAREHLDIVFLHRPDPSVPIEDSVAALADLQRAGLIRHIGVSNVSPAQLAKAQTVASIAILQNRYSIADRHDDALIDELAARRIAYVPYGPLGASPVRAGSPLALDPVLATIARARGRTPGQVALAWLLQRSPNLLPIPGTTRPDHLDANVAAATMLLSEAELAHLNRLGR